MCKILCCFHTVSDIQPSNVCAHLLIGFHASLSICLLPLSSVFSLSQGSVYWWSLHLFSRTIYWVSTAIKSWYFYNQLSCSRSLLFSDVIRNNSCRVSNHLRWSISGVFVTLLSPHFSILPTDYTSVSYTHLDVYKRQVCCY